MKSQHQHAASAPLTDIVANVCARQRSDWIAGRQLPAETYLDRHPDLQDDTDATLDLIYNEIVIREELGDQATLQEFVARFPQLSESLRQLFAVHEVLASDSSLSGHSHAFRSASTLTLPSATPNVRRESGPVGAGVDAAEVCRTGATRSEAPRPAARTIGGYEILDELGRGGMGIVYRALQPGTGRVVALKVILTGRFASQTEIVRFQTEAQAAARLEHPGIVPVYDAGCDGDLYFLSMALVRGETLEQVLTRGPMSAARAAEVTAQLADAVAAAHRQDVVHRDLKPQNVLMDADGRVRVTDFGLARQNDQLCSLTSTGQVVGTPQYMPPEQAAGRHEQIGPTSDVYSLGATLYSALTGRAPFTGSSAVEILNRVIRDEPLSPRILNPAVPRDLETICLKCLEKEPHQRYATAKELADDLRRFQHGEPINARPVGVAGRLWRWWRRKPVIAGLTTTVAVLLLAVVTGSIAGLLRLQAEHAETLRHLTRAVNAESLANKRLLDSLVNQAIPQHRELHAGQKIESLAAIREAHSFAREHVGPAARERGDTLAPAQSDDGDLLLRLRNEAVKCLLRTDVGTPELADVEHTMTAAIHPSGDAYAAWDCNNCGVTLCDWRTGRERRRWPVEADDVTRLQFSNDGRWLGFVATESSRTRLRVIDTADFESSPVDVPIASGEVVGFDFVPQPAAGQPATRRSDSANWSAAVVVVTRAGVVAVCDIKSGSLVRSFDVDAPATGCKVSRDGRRAVILCGPRFRLLNLSDGSMTGDFEHHIRGAILACDWNADDTLLVTAGEDHLATVWDVTDVAVERFNLQGHETWVTEAAFHPEKNLLVTSGRREGPTCRTCLWNPFDAKLLVEFEGAGRGFTADGSRLIGALQDQLATWPLEPNRLTSRLVPGDPDWPAICGQFNRDGTVLLTSGWDDFDLWDFPARRSIAFRRLPRLFDVRMSADGQYLLSSAEGGLQRWPVIQTAAGQIQLGTPQELPLPAGLDLVRGFHVARSGAIAVIGYGCAVVSHSGNWSDFGPVLHHPDADSAHISPDGRWLASFGADAHGVRVWDAVSGECVCSPVPDKPGAYSQFSPDGQWLLAGAAGDWCFWNVADWTLSHAAESLDKAVHSVSFTADSKIMAASDESWRVKLIDVATGQELLTLPSEYHFTAVHFTPDDSQLVLMDELNGVRIWDLTQLRSELQKLDLLW